MSVDDSFYLQILNFVSRIAQRYNFCGDFGGDNDDCTQMGAIKFGDTANIITNFHNTKAGFIHAVNTTSYDKGTTHTYE